MKTKIIDIITSKQCKYLWEGENIADLRRVKLFRIGQAMEIGDAQSSKNELLTAMIAKLDMMSAEIELTDMIDGL